MKGFLHILMLISLAFAGTKAFAQEDCDASVIIPEADRKYRTGNFDEVFQILNPCLKTKFSPNAQVQAYKIIALTYLALDSLPQAATAVRNLLVANQNYEPEFSALPQFKDLVAQQRDLMDRIIQITSVSKKAENLLQVPATVTVLTQTDIVKRGYKDLTQMLNDIPGFDVIRGNGPSYVTFYQRGYRSTSNDRTILLVDGVEENDLNSDNIPVSRQYALSDIERVEVIYGPASTMYGANAFMGVINLITKRFLDQEMPEGKKMVVSTNGQVRYGSLNTKLVDGVVTVRTKDVAVSVTSRYFSSNELDYSKYPEWNYDPRTANNYPIQQNINGAAAQTYITNNKLTTLFPNSNLYQIGYDANGAANALSLTDAGKARAAELDNANLFQANVNGSRVGFNDDSKNFYIRAKVEFKDFMISLMSWKTDEGATPWYTNRSRIVTPEVSRWVANNKAFSLTYNKFISEKVQILNLTSYRLHELNGATNLPTYRGYFNGSYSIIDLLNERKPTYSIPYWYRVSNQLRNEFRVLLTPLPKLDINSGIEIRNSIIQANYITAQTENADETGRPDSTLAGGDNFRVFDIGIFTQATYNWTESLKTVLGSRLDHNQIRSNGGYGFVFNPRVSLIYSKGKFVLKGIYTEAFKDASYLQKYATNRERQLNNPTLQPERVKNVEGSVSVRFSKAMSFNVAGYIANYSNAVGLAAATTPAGVATQQFQALGKQRIIGLQSEARYDVKNLNVWGNLTYSKPRDLSKVEGQKIPVSDIAPWSANLGAVYEPVKNLSISVTNNYVSARKSGTGTSGSSNPITRFEPIYLLNSTLTYHNVLNMLSLQVQVSNVFNHEYFVPGIRAAEGITSASRYPQEGRVFSIGLLFDTNRK
ncbi:TonB-dependent receptor [Dyadobacter chenwenxiniae]|uniref:TonB-dependent receptor n=1 Tax=Dyadobacter chenwenxiniae TaxID=2906456 RepID=A0A9X1TEP8_9BACT|nr:TonB-dependent receptor [Dyadobacter chenwenxiniae]MCF0063431.1 TonB-dependent receptor [Dyadobacter chenwenxiniae]UON85190.1 TonB-dependent receptor [Dyadobacter chenwenxiniae]